MPQITNTSLSAVTANVIAGQFGKEPAVWRNTAASTYEQGLGLTALLRDSSAKNMRNTYRVRQPIVRSIDGVDTVVAVATASVDFTFPKTTTSAERLALLADVAALTGNAAVQSSCGDLSPHY